MQSKRYEAISQCHGWLNHWYYNGEITAQSPELWVSARKPFVIRTHRNPPIIAHIEALDGHTYIIAFNAIRDDIDRDDINRNDMDRNNIESKDGG